MRPQDMTRTCRAAKALVSRRQLLILGGTSITVLGALSLAPGLVGGAEAQLVMSTYPERKLMSLAALKPREPVEFDYPTPDVTNLVVKLEERAGGGIGPDEDIVAFNLVCTHMGGWLGTESYKPEHSILGPCPLHLTTFDLTRHGMVVSGHATESLPQIALELRGEDIYAVGVMGLLYGYSSNPTAG